MSCPFYGVELIAMAEGTAPVLLPSRIDRCALITDDDVSCIMQLAGEEAAWDLCLRNPANNGTYFDSGIPAPEPIAHAGLQFDEKGNPIRYAADRPLEFSIQPDTPESAGEKGRTARQVSDAYHSAHLDALRKADPTSVIGKIEGSE